MTGTDQPDLTARGLWDMMCSASSTSPRRIAPERLDQGEVGRFRRFTHNELVARDTASWDIFWLRDESLEDIDNLPLPHVVATEIVEDLQAALSEFAALAESLAARVGPSYGDEPGSEY